MFGKSKIKDADLVTVLTTLSWMMDSGISMKGGVEELLNNANNKMNKDVLKVLYDDLDDGRQLSEIFHDHEDLFGHGRWRQLDAAEQTGKLSDAMIRMAEQIRDSSDLLSQIRGAIMYPAIVFLFALFAGYYMFTNVIPEMGDMLIEFGVEMPAITVSVMSISTFIVDNLVAIVLGIVLTVFIFRWLTRGVLRMSWHKLLVKFPYIGTVSVNMNYSSVYTLLSDMLANGAHVTEALRVASGSSNNVYIASELLDAATSMETEGTGLTDGLLATKTMPSDDKLMLQIGQRTGRDMELLPKLSVRRKKEAKESIAKLMAVLPVVALIAVGALVGVMVVSLYMPMISITNAAI